MKFDLQECTGVLHESLMRALRKRAHDIEQLHKTEEAWAISYDILPWDPYVGVAFRVASESGGRASQDSGEWKHSHFIEEINTPELTPAKDYAHGAYLAGRADGRHGHQEAAHLIFFAAANALLDESVALFLRSVSINAPVIGDTLPWNYFKYIVIDGDGVIKANYCDIVCANRVTRRLLGNAL
jgi:hypothetical protein